MRSVDVPGDNSSDLDVSLNRIMAAEILILIILLNLITHVLHETSVIYLNPRGWELFETERTFYNPSALMFSTQGNSLAGAPLRVASISEPTCHNWDFMFAEFPRGCSTMCDAGSRGGKKKKHFKNRQGQQRAWVSGIELDGTEIQSLGFYLVSEGKWQHIFIWRLQDRAERALAFKYIYMAYYIILYYTLPACKLEKNTCTRLPKSSASSKSCLTLKFCFDLDHFTSSMMALQRVLISNLSLHGIRQKTPKWP